MDSLDEIKRQMAHRDRQEANKNRLDLYWRLRDDSKTTKAVLQFELSQAGRHFAVSNNKTELIAKVAHDQRGFLNYEAKCTTSELQGFMIARNLPSQKKRQTMIGSLQTADRNIIFARFSDLPPELRNRIYEFHFADMPKRLRPCSQPPISRTSKLFRSESLPLFFRTKIFMLSWNRPDKGKGHALRAVDKLTQFLAKTAAHHFGHMRRLQLCIQDPAFEVGTGVQCDISLNPTTPTYVATISTTDDRYSFTNADLGPTTQALQIILKNACEREKRKGLSTGDFSKMREVLWGFVSRQNADNFSEERRIGVEMNKRRELISGVRHMRDCYRHQWG